ncbi:SDR family NAD(P)-dependent oxidoreductase [Chitinophaga sancti]|uniref:SDR family NAD(P)-dependent oxidoreductase n=1 Tax=Chitinophaga sancti TaxID=1004 RepID=A0ABZ0XM63_9BACT|nr:SDR family NAD(P)-dependent oxidoreductase [Chitinophaga sancti]WQG91778.1 SDR family NAD(P)-dependent oxidoreductase [Chitinophaga sancti]
MHKNDINFTNKIVWITGASSGIGEALAVLLAQKKAKLILTARRAEALEALAQNLHTAVKILAADLCATDFQNLTKEALESFGTIDMVIHAAGIGQRSLAVETPLTVYRRLMEINFFAPVAITGYLLPVCKAHMVVIGSMSGLMGFPGRTGYAASKHALKGYFETLQVEQEVPVTIVSPGRVQTNLSLSALTADGTPHGVMDEAQVKGIPVMECATRILKGVAMQKKHVIIARKEKYLYWLHWWWPKAYFKVAGKYSFTQGK